tara:strand:+ start:2669 stop:3424 length:756 start_codon:yes stop_codon:yes gene_type:complete
MDLISIVIPYYKKSEFIGTTIQSILKQTYKNFEIIIVYDDNDKKDLKLIYNIKKKDKRIRVIINNKNIGAGKSRNKAILKARGNYLSFIDADDIWMKNKLKNQLRFMKSKKILISHTSYNIINEANKVIGKRNSRDIKNFKKLLLSCDIGLSTVMIKKSLLKNNLKFSDTKTKEDFVLWLKIVRSGVNIYSLKNSLTSWRKLKGSLSSSTYQKIVDGFLVYKKHMGFNVIMSIFYLFMLSINFFLKNNISK